MVRTSSLRGYLMLYALSRMRRGRRVARFASRSRPPDRCLGRSHRRGRANEPGARAGGGSVPAPGQGLWRHARPRLEELPDPDGVVERQKGTLAPATLRELRDAALADEHGNKLRECLVRQALQHRVAYDVHDIRAAAPDSILRVRSRRHRLLPAVLRAVQRPGRGMDRLDRADRLPRAHHRRRFGMPTVRLEVDFKAISRMGDDVVLRWRWCASAASPTQLVLALHRRRRRRAHGRDADHRHDVAGYAREPSRFRTSCVMR